MNTRPLIVPGPLLLGLVMMSAPAFGPGCGYSPSFDSGRLRCGPNDSCPEGYYCASDDRCWRDGEEPDPPDPDPQVRLAGTWNFIRPSTRTILCSDGSGGTEDWAGRDFIPIEAGSGGTLEADFFCVWILDIAASGNATVIRPGQSCSDTDPNEPDISYTWRGEAFTVTSTDGRTGTGQMSLPYDYRTPAGNGTCTMTYSVTLTKNTP